MGIGWAVDVYERRRRLSSARSGEHETAAIMPAAA
jgi:hypothetical protein